MFSSQTNRKSPKIIRPNICINPISLHKQDVTQVHFYTGWNSEFSYSLIGCHTKVKGPHRPYYLTINLEYVEYVLIAIILDPY